MNRTRTIQSKYGGFTVVELAVVIVIIGVLVSISVPLYSSAVNAAKLDRDSSIVSEAVAAAKSQYAYDSALYYASADDLDMNERKYCYDAQSGTALESTTGLSLAGYGESEIEDTDGSKTGAIGWPRKDGEAHYVTVLVSSDGQARAYWGKTVGATWRTVIKDLGMTDNAHGGYQWVGNKVLREKVLAIDDETRIAADKDVIAVISDYFIGKSDSELREILGGKYNNAVQSQAMLFGYQIDNNSCSIRLSFPSNGLGYLTSLGYSDKQANGNDVDPSTYTNYMSQYLFSSNAMVEQTGVEHQVKLKLTMKDGACVASRVWVEGVSYLDSDALD